MGMKVDVKETRLEGTMTEGEGIEPTPGGAAAAIVEHCIITFARVLAVFVQRVDPRVCHAYGTESRDLIQSRCTYILIAYTLKFAPRSLRKAD